MPTTAQKIPWGAHHIVQEPTRFSFSRAIESWETVPDAYKSFFEPLIVEGHKFPYAVLTPAHRGYIHRANEKLVCTLDSGIHILERNGNNFAGVCHPVPEISYVEVRAILLDSSIKITGTTKSGTPKMSIVQFNSVTDYLFTPILRKIRGFETDRDLNVLRTEMDKFDEWAKPSFKFMNYARSSLMGSEKVFHSILQPEIRTNGFRIFGRTYYKTISPAHASILTDRELIMIREEVRYGGEDRYGGIWDYIPLNKITDLTLRNVDRNLLSLSIQLPNEAYLEFLYQASAKEKLLQLITQFKELTA